MICVCNEDEQQAALSKQDAAELGGGDGEPPNVPGQGEPQEIPPKETPTLTPPTEKKPYIPKGMTLRQARHDFHMLNVVI